jgi:hypothetical protein
LSFASKRQILGERLGKFRAGFSLALREAVNCASNTPEDDILDRFGFKHPYKVIFQPCLSSNTPAGWPFGSVWIQTAPQDNLLG